jgi:hypothetical protein
MKKNIAVFLVFVAMVALASVAWAGEEYVKETQLSNGVTAYQAGRTGAFGPTYRSVTLVGKPEPQPAILRLQSGETTVSETTTTFSRCSQRREDGTLKQAYFVGEEKKTVSKRGFQDAVNPANGQQPWTTTTDAKGTGWVQGSIEAGLRGVPNAFIGAFAPGCNVTQNGGGASQTQGQASNNKLVGVNSNNNSTKIGIDNKAISGSRSSAGAESGKGH